MAIRLGGNIFNQRGRGVGGNLNLQRIFGGGGSGVFGPGITIGTNIPIGFSRVVNPDVGDARTTHDNTLSKFVRDIGNESGLWARPSLFKIVMTPASKLIKKWGLSKLRQIGFNCHQISIPGNNIATKALKTYGLKKEYVYDKLFDEISSSFYVSESMDEYHFFETWQDLMYKPNQSVGWFNEYVGTLEIHQLSKHQKFATTSDIGSVCKYTLVDAYPKLLSPLQLDYSASNTIQRMTVNWTFRDMIVEPRKGLSGGKIFEDIPNSPLPDLSNIESDDAFSEFEELQKRLTDRRQPGVNNDPPKGVNTRGNNSNLDVFEA